MPYLNFYQKTKNIKNSNLKKIQFDLKLIDLIDE